MGNNLPVEFRWNAANVEHVDEHGVTPAEAEYVVDNNAFRAIGDGKYLAIGQRANGQYIQVIFIFSPPGVVYVIHSRPLTDREKRRHRRRRR